MFLLALFPFAALAPAHAFAFSPWSAVQLLATPALAQAEEKKTVCSATINSSEEIELFKKHLGTKNFKFVELTSYAKEDNKNNFLNEACKAGVTCDILVISGHFGGNFFGASGINLPIETLEAGECSKACDGILRKPKEVFLFGCNTLAGKNEDRRTPEQYRRVLMEDGFSTEEAERVVAFRYSPIGDSFSDRMSRVFYNSPRIYGFNSIAPSGKTIQPLLASYLKKAGPEYPAYFSSLDQSKNEVLASALRDTSLVQAMGAKDTTSRDFMCKMKDPKITLTRKLELVENILASGNYINQVDYIAEALGSYQWIKENIALGEDPRKFVGGGLTAQDDAIFQRIKALNKSKELLPLIMRPVDTILTVQLRLLKLLRVAEWITPAQQSESVVNLVLGGLDKPFSQETLDRIGSNGEDLMSIEIDIDNLKIPSARWTDQNFLNALETLSIRGRSAGLFLLKKLHENKLNPDNSARIAQSLGNIIGSLGKRDSSGKIHLLAIQMLEAKPESEMQQLALIQALRHLDKKSKYLSYAVKTLTPLASGGFFGKSDVQKAAESALKLHQGKNF